MKKLSILFLMITILFTSSSPLWAFGGKSSRVIAPKKPGEIFGVMPWEIKNSLITKNAVIGIDSLEINDEKAVFKDLIDRELSVPQPEEVTYYFVNERVYRIHLLYVGSSRPFKDYSKYFTGIYGESLSIQDGDYIGNMWTRDKYILQIKSNYQAELERQLKQQKNESDKVVVTIEVIFTGNGN